jgi:hypothetical protein
MPKSKPLSRFNLFVSELFPHEVEYLIACMRFEDTEMTRLMNQVHKAVIEGEAEPWDEKVDKRKYSRLMVWCSLRLAQINVDSDFKQLLELKNSIREDNISPADEKSLISRLRAYQKPCFNFIQLYQLAQSMNSFLLIRLRETDQKTVQQFLKKFKSQYQQSLTIQQQMDDATEQIVAQYRNPEQNTRHWEKWLIDVFRNTQLDGDNRYSAIVRLTFLYYNYLDYEKLQNLYHELDTCFHDGQFYSRRILVNYYSNRVLMHARFDEWEMAEKYAWLSITQKGTDHLYYLNNLCAVLLRTGKEKIALSTMKAAFAELKSTTSAHNKVSFAALYTRTLIKNQMTKQAARFAQTWLNANTKEVLSNRWHLYFSQLILAQLSNSNYLQALGIIQKFKLLEKDIRYKSRPNYTPAIPWLYAAARFLSQKDSMPKLIKELQKHIPEDNNRDKHQNTLLNDLYQEIRKLIPELPIFLHTYGDQTSDKSIG